MITLEEPFAILQNEKRVTNHGESLEPSLQPTLVINDPPKRKVLNTLVQELRTCSYFDLFVAFITESGLRMIYQDLRDAAQRGVKGRIITGDYLNFTQPQALRALASLAPSIETRLSMEEAYPMHAKGYLFYPEDKSYASFIIGSSNLTSKALATTQEWNVRVVSHDQDELYTSVKKQFLNTWESSHTLSEALILQYERKYASFKRPEAQQELESEENLWKPIEANTMQQEALASLKNLRKEGKKRALLISATGTGKTFLSAFDVAFVRPKKFLYIVHRQQVAKESMNKFKEIIGSSLRCTLLGGNALFDKDAPYVFSMIQTLSKDDVLQKFQRDEFDYIVIDEVHRAGAASYKKVLSYFDAQFILGMTATPERTDNENIYELFDYNIAYDIRLNQALEANLLSPFHYYGISDLAFDGIQAESFSQFSLMEKKQWVKHIITRIQQYTFDNTNRRGLIFVSRVDIAHFLSHELNNRGFKTRALSGQDSDYIRDQAFDDIEDGILEYLIAVDILNEGIDIPSLNQIIMLRPTQSAIIFVQQLGRGLRKSPGKEFLIVLDFIGNYTNNYLIPIALYGDTTYKKDQLRKLLSSSESLIHGESSISFDQVAKERVYQAINGVNFATQKFLKEAYEKLKMKVGRIPTMVDAIEIGGISPLLFIDYAKSYYNFKLRIREISDSTLLISHLKSLEFFSKVIAPGIRIQELSIVNLLLTKKRDISIGDIQHYIAQEYTFEASEASIHGAISILQNKFYQLSQTKRFKEIVYCYWDANKISISEEFETLLLNEEYYQELVDVLQVGHYEFSHFYASYRQSNDFSLHQKYSRQDVCRLLNWEKDMGSTLYGYKVNYKKHECPIFVTYHKDVDNPLIDYGDHFVSPKELVWETRTPRTLQSKEIQAIIQQENPLRFHLFVKKSDDEGTDSYYLGEVKYIPSSAKDSWKVDAHNKKVPVVEMRFSLCQPVPSSLYQYITSAPPKRG